MPHEQVAQVIGQVADALDAAGALGLVHGTVAPATADSAKYLGCALHDAKSGEAVTVSFDSIQRPIASGAITAGAKVYTAAAGKVSATGTNNPIGIALTTVADGAQVEVKTR